MFIDENGYDNKIKLIYGLKISYLLTFRKSSSLI
jgi:hypothetical protein